MTAPARKHSAPTNVPRLDSSACHTSPFDGTMKPATADTPKAIEPAMFTAPIHQSRDLGPPSVSARAASIQAIALATRKATDPSASGRHTRSSDVTTARFWRSALPVLQLNHSVPASCTAHASHPSSRGAQTRYPPADSRYCSSAAEVKNSEPTKTVAAVGSR